MSLPNEINSLLVSTTGRYQIERSLRFNSADSAYLNRTFVTPTNAFIFTISAWVKRSGSSINIENIFGVGTGSAAATSWLGFSNDVLYLSFQDGSYFVRSSAVYRDFGAWYHIVAAVDTTQATDSNRVKLYVNGLQLTAVTASYPPQNSSWQMNGAYYHVVGARYRTSIDSYFNGYITDFNFVDGQSLTPSSFGETSIITGVWQPKKYTGTYGTNGFYLKFADNSGTTSTTLGKDSSGNGNNWTPNNFSVTAGADNDSLIDTPTPYADGGNGRGNYCTWNPLKTGTNLAPEDGNLFARMQSSGSGINQSTTGTFYVSSRKWYWEGTSYNTVSGYAQIFGIASVSFTSLNAATGSTGQTYGYEKSALKYDGSTSSAYGASYTTNDVIGVALDLDAGTLVFYKNGVSQGTAFTGLSGTFAPYCGLTYSGGGPGFYTNFGQRPFAYTPPSGFLAMNTQNLPTPTVQKPSNYMDVVTYTGTGASLTPTSSLGFSPDFVWIKGRSGATDHAIYDAVRGVQLDLVSNSTAAETTQSQGLTAFNSNGFTIGTLAKVNTSTATYAAWCWDESATPGFDIVTYTGDGTTSANRLIDHSLGVKPDFVITKKRSGGTDYGWSCWHKDLGGNYGIWLNLTNARNANMWAGYSNFSATKFTPPDLLYGNENGATYVNYLWSEVAGFSKFGSYTGNGSSDGPFVYCGFKPRWLMIKRSDSVESWLMFDTARESYNPTDDALWANLSNAESANYTPQDFLSNGFKIRTISTSTNASGGTYIFAAFAETPFKNSLAR